MLLRNVPLPVPSLDGCYQRVARAREHLTDCKQRTAAICETKRDNVFIERKPGRIRLPDGRWKKAVLGTVQAPFGPLPAILSILVGETIYNLRAALDYLVYELAILDSGQVKEKTQFPIDDCEKVFRGRRSSYLKGVNEEHVAALKRLQPCDGCQWTRVLRELSNSDKHRHLTITTAPVTVSPSPGSTEAILAGQPVDVKGDVFVTIVFSNGTPVVETLEQLQSEVVQVLDAFNSEFKRRQLERLLTP